MPDHSTFQAGQRNNFIIGSADVTTWGGQYINNNTYFMVNIPVTGAVKVEYTIMGGGTYAVFVDTTMPTKWEIGLKTIDGVTDVLESVCVTFTDGAPFASVPADAATSTQHKATHYLRKLDAGGTENWWSSDAAFTFAGETKTVCVVTDGVVRGADVAGPFPKPQPTASCGGYAWAGMCWYLSSAGVNCQTTCAAHGGDIQPATFWADRTGAECDAVLNALWGPDPNPPIGAWSGEADLCYYDGDGYGIGSGLSHDPTWIYDSSSRAACACAN
ncbi:hypothetical protein U14_05573 [Candidatus Moduliflexus flocculans]|uniref:Uncharacterized protein n=1 Tax=Candidatus Moduliflexus flocculans TaxID=1499966 RepID=A0A081BSB2_9BACT|nr:hypothetical protein U14_05573 [Candidatus Moduliflexus flocculans]